MPTEVKRPATAERLSLVEAMFEAAAVDVEGFEDLQHRADGNVPVVGPADHMEVFLPGHEAIKDAVAHVERGGKVLLDTQKD